MKRLNDDVTWTTNLGNAFLAQQQDVMDAVQRMRQRAQQAGRLQSTPQLNVQTTNENGQPYIDIEPADPDVMYVPVYDPVWIWGPPLWYPYPRWYWPPRSYLRGGCTSDSENRNQCRTILRIRLARMGRLGLASRMGRSPGDCEQHLHSSIQFQCQESGQCARHQRLVA